jgi:hypothetical protein
MPNRRHMLSMLFTYISNWRSRIDTRIRVRLQDGVIQSLDLTADPDARGS